jgi:DNA-binding FadR family transcriptional regulator
MIETGSLIRSLSGRPAARNFHSFVINEIGLGIVTGRYPVGSILPNDAEMCERFSVSRTVLREALKTLEAKGLIEARPKVGTRVSPVSRWSYFDSQVLSWHFDAKPDVQLYAGLFDVRRALESRAAQLSAAHRTAEHVRLMKYWLHQMDIAGDAIENHGIAVLEIHRTLADSSSNPLLRSAMGIVELTLALALKSLSTSPDGAYLSNTLSAHTDLVDAVEKGDAARAATALESAIALDEARLANYTA